MSRNKDNVFVLKHKFKTPKPGFGNGIPRCESYLKVKSPDTYMKRGIDLGAVLVSPMQDRNWGDKVGYLSDMDGHIIAFAKGVFHFFVFCYFFYNSLNWCYHQLNVRLYYGGENTTIG